MIIDSPIISGSYLSTGSLSQTGNVSITGSLTVTNGITGSIQNAVSASYALTASYLTGYVSPFPFTGSAEITGSLGVTGSFSVSGSTGTVFSSNADILLISGSLVVTGSTIITGSLSVSGSITGSLFGTASQAVSASYANFALTSSYSLAGSGFPYSGSAVITGSLVITNLETGSGVRYLVADASGLIQAQTASAVIFTTQQTIATAGQTVFPITNGYSTGYVTVFVNGSKLNDDEFTDTSGTNIVFATGSMINDVVEFQKYLPASGVSNNTLRTTNYFTTTLGQTNFTVNYTPGLLDVFYNGSKLSNTEYTAANGTSILLATGSNAGDTLEVDVYSYQVGAFSGIGGVGVANQIAYYNTTNSITGSNAFTVSGSAIIITGSLTVSGSGTFTNIGPAVFSGSVTSTAGFSGSFSGNADSASLAQNSLLLQGTGSVGFTTTASFLAVSSSQQQISASQQQLSSSFLTLTASFNAVSASQQQISASLLNVISIFATTGSNSFRETQSITGSLTVTGQIIAQSINVQQVTSSIVYSSGSNVFGCDLNSRQTFTGSVLITGSLNTAGTITGTTIYGSTAVCAPLFVGGVINGSGFCTSGGIVGNNSNNLYLSSNSAAGEISFWGNQLNTRLMTLTGCGSLGIGVAAPRSILEVLKTTGNTSLGVASNFNLLLSQGGAINEYSQIGFGYTSTNSPAVIGYITTCATDYTKGSLIFATRDAVTDTVPTERMRICSNGFANFACELTAKTLGTNDLILNNLNYECANYVDGTRGSWLIQEGACDLFIINQISCKKYKFNLIEIK